MDNRRTRAFFTVIVLLVCVSVIGSFFFIAANAEHECTHGDDCAVCGMIDACVHIIRVVFGAAAAVGIAAASVLIFRAVVRLTASHAAEDTLVTMKVELLD